jgi:hypothetical protein
MTMKTSSRARTTRVASKAKPKRAKTKAKKAVARKGVRRTKLLAKKKPASVGAKPKARPRTSTSSVVAWPGLPPGYFERGR